MNWRDILWIIGMFIIYVLPNDFLKAAGCLALIFAALLVDYRRVYRSDTCKSIVIQIAWTDFVPHAILTLASVIGIFIIRRVFPNDLDEKIHDLTVYAWMMLIGLTIYGVEKKRRVRKCRK